MDKFGLTRGGEPKLNAILSLLDGLRRTAVNDISKSEHDTAQEVLRKIQKNLTEHISMEKPCTKSSSLSAW